MVVSCTDQKNCDTGNTAGDEIVDNGKFDFLWCIPHRRRSKSQRATVLYQL